MMCLHLSFFILAVASAKALFASDPDFLGGPSDQPLFDEDQALLPVDLTDLAVNQQQSSAIDDAFWSLSGDTSILSPSENIVSSPNDFSIASDPFASADCSTSENPIFPSTGKSRLRRLARCDALDNNGSPPMLSIPTVDNFDNNLREAILRENPALYDVLQSSQNKAEDNTPCIIISVGILPLGVCSSVTVNDWEYRASRTFSWNWMYTVILWDLSNITPGMAELQTNFRPRSIQSELTDFAFLD